MDGWNISFLLGRPIFRGYVSFTEGTIFLRATVAVFRGKVDGN